jgi:DNA-binding NarL/FixJ family response regulator
MPCAAFAIDGRAPSWDRLRSYPAAVLLIDSHLQEARHICSTLFHDSAVFVVMIAAPDDDEWILEALSAGARGVLGRDASTANLLKAIAFVLGGQIWAPRRVLSAAWLTCRHLAKPEEHRQPSSMIRERLSTRECEVVQSAAVGLTNKQVAAILGIRPATVKTHLTQIYRKLGLQRRSELAAAYGRAVPCLPALESAGAGATLTSITVQPARQTPRLTPAYATHQKA